jgi:enoyl-[acyl-carrier protein] reductase I
MGFLKDKKVLIVGVASNRSIAWGAAQAMAREGAELAFTYQGEKLEKRVRNLAAELGSDIVLPCDVSSDEQITAVFDELGKKWDGLDSIVHSVAFAPRDQLEGTFADAVTREGFAMSYLGAVRVVPNYNVMGVAKASLEASMRYLAASLGPEGTRVNAVSAGPIRTLAASGIGDFRSMLSTVAEKTPLRRNVTIDEVGNASAFLCSDLASGITGDVLYVDTGYHILGMA